MLSLGCGCLEEHAAGIAHDVLRDEERIYAHESHGLRAVADHAGHGEEAVVAHALARVLEEAAGDVIPTSGVMSPRPESDLEHSLPPRESAS